MSVIPTNEEKARGKKQTGVQSLPLFTAATDIAANINQHKDCSYRDLKPTLPDSSIKVPCLDFSREILIVINVASINCSQHGSS